MKALILPLWLTVALADGPSQQKFKGVITDSMCAEVGHSAMRMGPTEAECAIACINLHDAAYVLYDGKQVYALSDQKMPQKFAGRKVTVTGALDLSGKTIEVDSITAAK